jgi:hypothetical protein
VDGTEEADLMREFVVVLDARRLRFIALPAAVNGSLLGPEFSLTKDLEHTVSR